MQVKVAQIGLNVLEHGGLMFLRKNRQNGGKKTLTKLIQEEHNIDIPLTKFSLNGHIGD
jgi:hypothetical protein